MMFCTRGLNKYSLYFQPFVLVALSCLLALSSYSLAFSQSLEGDSFSVVSFNVENLFDTIPNPDVADGEYLPFGVKEWTGQRYWQKIRLVGEAISLAGGMTYPWFVALQEVENLAVVEDLMHSNALRGGAYKAIVSDGRDRRGINVAILYAEGLFRPKRVEQWEIPFPEEFDEIRTTRPILFVEGVLLGSIPLSLLVIHFPSRRNNDIVSNRFREEATRLLARKCDSLLLAQPEQAIMVLGDFNSTPYDQQTMVVATPLDEVEKVELRKMYDISSAKQLRLGSMSGSYYIKRQFQQIDRILLSHHFFGVPPEGKLRYLAHSFVNAPLPGKMRRLANGQFIPRRTYGGDTYLGGTSDHFPIVAEFVVLNAPRDEKE